MAADNMYPVLPRRENGEIDWALAAQVAKDINDSSAKCKNNEGIGVGGFILGYFLGLFW